MKLDRKTQRGLVTGVILIGLGWLVVAGCGGESTRPQPEVKVMGGILIARGMPAGAPYQAGAVVSVDGQLVTDAEVRINGAPLTWVENPVNPAQTGYVGLVAASQGDLLTLVATAAGQTVTLQATVPGVLEIHPPAGGLVYADDQDIPISWVPAAGAAITIVTCGGASSATPDMWLVAPTASAHTIPASATTVPGDRISIMGINGSGDLPSTMDLRQWAGKRGFWVTSQDYLDVLITT
jgi:hypothetical protein